MVAIIYKTSHPLRQNRGLEQVTKAESRQPSRRNFMKGGLLGAMLGAASPLRELQPVEADDSKYPKSAGKKPSSYDFHKQSGALDADSVVASACQFCNALCALNVHMKAGRIIDVTGESQDPVQAGGLCAKGPMMTELVYNAQRLKRPLRRVSGKKGSATSRFEECSWDQALDLIAKKLLALRDAGEARSIASKTTGRMLRGAGSVIERVFKMLGSPNNTDVGPVCNDAGGNALAWTFGLGNFTNGYGIDATTGKHDLGASKLHFFLGTNQAETHPVTFAYLLRQREQTGAKIICVDPRLTPTGAHADTWIAPKPHTDLALVLGMIAHIIDKGLVDQAFIKRWVLGYETLVKHIKAQGYSPEWAAKRCDVPAKSIRQIAEQYASAKPASIFCNAGISHQLNAFTTYRALAILASITGNIGKPGGGCNFMHNTWPGGLNLPPMSDPTPKIKDPAFPVGPDHFADAINGRFGYKLRALWTTGNILIQSSNTQKIKEALESLEFYVYTGLFMEEPAYYADVILPVCSGFEMDGVYMRRDDRAIRWQEQAVPRVGEARTDVEIWVDLAQALARHDSKQSKDYWTKNVPKAWRQYSKLWAEFVKRTPGVGGMSRERLKKRKTPLQWPCPSPKHPGVSTLYMDHKSWYEAAEALGHKGKRFLTASGKVEIFTPAMDKALKTAGHSALPEFFTHPEVTGQNESLAYSQEMVPNPINPQALTAKIKLGVRSDGAVHKDFPLMGMIGRASVIHFAGVTQWTFTGKQRNGVRLVQIHPETAKQAGVGNGQDILVRSPRGVIKATALLWDGLRKDTIFVPNSFGPAQSVGDLFGSPRYEAANTLLDDQYYDNLSGQQAYKCFACRIEKDPS